jgi:hypothetical protein
MLNTNFDLLDSAIGGILAKSISSDTTFGPSAIYGSRIPDTN